MKLSELCSEIHRNFTLFINKQKNCPKAVLLFI